MQYAFHQNTNGTNNNNNAQYTQQQQPQPPQPQNVNNNNSQLHNQINQMNQMQQSNQQQINAQMNQLTAMQHQFNQFQISPNNQQQQKPQPQQPQTQNSQQTSPQNQTFQQVQAQQFQSNQSPPQNQQQFSPFHAQQNNAQNQTNALNAAQQYQNAANFNFVQQQQPQAQQINGGSLFGQIQLPNVAQLVPQQQQQQQAAAEPSSIDVEASTLNPEIAEFNPIGGTSENAAVVQSTVQEQLFSQLQTINVQMQSIKHQTEAVLTPTLLQLQHSMNMFQSNPALLQNVQNYGQFMQTQQQYATIAYQIQQNQLNYAQLEQSLKYTQDLYQKNKDEQHVVPLDDENMEQTENGQPQQQMTNDMNANNNNNPYSNGTRYNLTSAVTDVGSNGLQQISPSTWDSQTLSNQQNLQNDDAVAQQQQQQQHEEQQQTNGNFEQQQQILIMSQAEEAEQHTNYDKLEENVPGSNQTPEVTQDVRSKANIVSFDDHFNQMDRYRSPPNDRFARNDNNTLFG